VIQIAEHTAGFEDIEDFSVQLPLALMLAVVDGEAGDHRVERTEVR